MMGGDTLAGGGAAKAGDSLRFTATAAGHGQNIYPEKQRYAVCVPLSFTKMTSSSSLVVAYVPAATMRGAYPLLRFRARVCGVDARAAIARMAASIT